MKKFVLMIFILTGIYGCASAPVERSLPAATAKSILASKVYVIVNNDAIQAPTSKSTGGSDYGIIGLIVDGAIDNVAHNKMVKALAPINKAAKDFDFKSQIIRALKRSHIFVHRNQVEFLKQAPDGIGGRAKLMKSSGSKPVVFITFTRVLTANYATLLVASDLSVYQGQAVTDKYSLSTRYQSKSMDSDRAVSSWATNHAHEYKNELSKGIDAVVNMLKVAIIQHPSNLPNPKDKTCSFYKIDSGYGPSLDSGKLVKSDGERCETLTPSGVYYSAQQVFKYKNSKIPKLSRSKGRVYFYNLQTNNMFCPSILADKKDIGVLNGNKVLYVDVKPGKHVFDPKLIGDRPGLSIAKHMIERLTPVEINVQKHKTYYVRYIGYKGLFTGSDDIKLTSSDTANKEMQDMILAR